MKYQRPIICQKALLSLLVRSPLQNPIACPVSPTHPPTPSIAAFTSPFAFLLVPLPLPAFRLPLPIPAPPPAPTAPSPVAYSLPILGKTSSPALRLTKSANGTNQTQIPKYDAISVNVGTSVYGSYRERPGGREGGVEKWRNQRKWLRRTRTVLAVLYQLLDGH